MTPRPAIPEPGGPRVTPEARRVAELLRPGLKVRSGFVGLTGAMHLEWADGISRLISPDQIP